MKKKILISSSIVFLIGILVATVIIFLYKRDNTILLKQDAIVIEYGSSYNPTINELIDLKKYNFINLDNVRMESDIENEDTKNYPAAGEYKINVYYKKLKLEQKIKVVDTIAPELSIKDNIEIPYNTDLTTYDFSELIGISDLSEIKEYNVNTDNVDSSTSGEYVVKVTAEDIYLNKSEQEFKITIQENKEIIEEKIDNSSNEKNNQITKEKEMTSSSKNEKTTEVNVNKQENTISNTNNETKKEEHKKEEIKTEPVIKEPETPKCTDTKHGVGVGNSNKWFNSYSEAVAYYDNLINKYSDQVHSGEITTEEYYKLCPYGYETWSCPYCGKWTLNFYYR